MTIFPFYAYRLMPRMVQCRKWNHLYREAEMKGCSLAAVAREHGFTVEYKSIVNQRGLYRNWLRAGSPPRAKRAAPVEVKKEDLLI